MRGDQRHHNDSQCARRTGDHAWSPADQRGDEAYDESGIKADQRMYTGDKRKSYGFRDQRQSNRQA